MGHSPAGEILKKGTNLVSLLRSSCPLRGSCVFQVQSALFARGGVVVGQDTAKTDTIEAGSR